MARIAELVLTAKTDSLEKGRDELDRFKKSGKEAGDEIDKSTDKMSDGFDDAGKGATKFGITSKQAFAAVAVAAGAAAVAVGALTYKAAINEATQFQTATLKTEAIIKATGGAAMRSAEQLRQQARAVGFATLESTEGVMRAQNTLLTFRKIQGDVFDETINAATDMSAALGGDLNSAVLQLGKALEDPVTGMSALSRSGTVFTTSQKEVVKSMVESGNQAAAQAFILSELEAQYGGAAEAAAGGLAGAQDTLGQATQEAGLAFVATTGALATYQAGTELLSSGVMFLTDHMSDVVGIMTAGFAAGLVAMTPLIYGAVTATAAWVVSLVTLKGALLATGIGVIIVGAGLLIGQFLDLVDATGGWGVAMRVLGSLVAGVWDGIATSAGAIVPALDAVWSFVTAGALKMIRSISQAWADFLHSVSSTSQYLDFMPGMDSTILALNNAAITAGAGVHTLTAEIDGYQNSADAALARSQALTSQGFEKASAALAVLNMVIAEHGASSAEAADATIVLNDALDDVATGSGKAAKALDKVKTEAEAFDKAMSDAAYTAEDFGTAKARTLISGVDGVASAWGDFVVRGFDDFKGFADSVVDSFAGMLSQMVTMAARNQIMIGLGIGGSVTGTAASGGALSGGGGVSGLLGGAGNLLGLGGGGGIAGAASGVWSGLSGVLSGGGLTSSFANLGGLISGASSGLGALGAALPAIGIAVVGITALVKAFSREYKGSGLRGHFGAEGFDGEQFAFYKGGAFRGDRTDTNPLDAEFEAVLDDSILGITQGLRDMAEMLDLNSDAIDGFIAADFQLWTNDMDQASIQAAFEDQMLIAANGMAELILTTEKFSQIGENAYETLTRLGNSLASVNNIMDLLNEREFKSTLSGGAKASDLIDQFGGADQFAATTSGYWQTYYSQAEQHEELMSRLADQFDGLNMTMPETREGFRDLVEAQRLGTTEGREAYAALLALSGAFADLVPETAEVVDGLDGVTEATGNVSERLGLLRQLYTLQGNDAKLAELQLARLDESNRALQERIWRLQTEAAIDREAYSIRTQLLQLRGAEQRLRDRELAGLDESNRALQQRVYDLQDEQAALAAQNAIADERRGLRETLWSTLGKTDKLRARELKGLDESNRALQERIWRIEDEAAILSNLSDDVSSAMGAVSAAISAEITNITDSTATQLDRLSSEFSEATAKADTARAAVIGFIDDIETGSVGAFERMRDQIQQVLDSRGAISVAQEAANYRRAQAQIFDFATGAEFTEDQLTAALGGVQADSVKMFGSFAEYAFDTAKTTQALVGLEAITEGQLTEAEQQVAALRALYDVSDEGFATIEDAIASMESETAKADQLEREIDTLEKWRDRQIEILENQLDAAQAQADTALGINDALLSVADALVGLGVSMGSLGSFVSTMSPNDIRNQAIAAQSGDTSALWAYEQRILNTDRSDLKPWETAVFDDLNGQGFAGGGYTGDGPRTGGLDGEGGRLTLIHPQESVIDHYGKPKGVDTNAELVREIRRLGDRLMALEEHARETKVNTGRSARTLADWDRNDTLKVTTL